MKTNTPKITLNKETVKNLKIKTHIKAGSHGKCV